MPSRYPMLSMLLAMLVIAQGAWAVEGKAPGKDTYAPGEILVKFKPGTSEARIDEINAHQGATVAEKMGGGLYLLRIREGSEVKEMVDRYSALPEVQYAEPNFIYHIQPKQQ
jgi:hypothetical protein